MIIPQPAADVARPATLSAATWAGVYLLLAVAMVLIAGYQFGVGNQGIQVPLLQRALDPALFAGDAMVTTTAPDYPTYFFRLLAWPAKWVGIERLYLLLHVLTSWALIATLAWLGRSIGSSRPAGIVTALMVLAGHHQALAGDGLYSTGFTHTFAVFPLAIAAMALAYRGRFVAAFVIAGLTFNLHALTSAYVFVFLIAAWAVSHRPWWQVAVLIGVFVAAASPTLRLMLAHRQTFGPQWINLTHIRSADHSFPSVWWQGGSSEVPRLALIAGIFAVSLGHRLRRRVRRQTLAIMAAAGAMCLAGYVFSEIWPWPLVLRAQVFRCSRLVMVLMMAHIAVAAVRSWSMRGWRGWLEVPSATFAVAVIAIPSLLPLLPIAFAAAVGVAVATGRLSIGQAVAAGVAGFVCVAAWRDFQFPLIAQPAAMTLSIGLAAIAGVGLIVLLARLTREQRFLLPGAAIIAVLLLTIGLHAPADEPWTRVQAWARNESPAGAVFLTPIQPGGFRLQSGRAVVGEWRDGTQLYFSAAYGPQWWQRMADLQPGLLTDASGRNVLSRGRPLDGLDDEQLVALARKYHATHIVLPKRPDRELPLAYENQAWAVYLPQLKEPEAPSEATDKAKWVADEKFMRDTVLPNIEKHRKSDVRLQLLDETGRPLAGATVEVRQKNSAFNFSGSLPFFQTPASKSLMGDYHPPPVEKAELERFAEIFNASMIPFSGKWMYIEPVEGTRHYAELDQYIDWCVAQGIRLEYHFLSGYFGPWMKAKNEQEKGEAFLRHARDLAQRYGDKIEYWQVVNEKILLQQSPAVFKELRQLMPRAKLGISDCAKFAPETRSRRRNDQRSDMDRGIAEIRWLKEQGVQLDFFGFHGHRPFGIWPEASQMYATLDQYAKEGVRLHITEFCVPQDTPVLGPLRAGTFTPDVQAQFYERFYTICFSHPSVDLINLWGIGPNTWQKGAGLLDAEYKPKPAFEALKKLFTQTWRTNTTLKLGLDGAASFRGFHGEYEAVVNVAGKPQRVSFAIKPDEAEQVVRLQIRP